MSHSGRCNFPVLTASELKAITQESETLNTAIQNLGLNRSILYNITTLMRSFAFRGFTHGQIRFLDLYNMGIRQPITEEEMKSHADYLGYEITNFEYEKTCTCVDGTPWNQCMDAGHRPAFYDVVLDWSNAT